MKPGQGDEFQDHSDDGESNAANGSAGQSTEKVVVAAAAGDV
jgi:hypothetical protein